jgi:hypothetical protein
LLFAASKTNKRPDPPAASSSDDEHVIDDGRHKTPMPTVWLRLRLRLLWLPRRLWLLRLLGLRLRRLLRPVGQLSLIMRYVSELEPGLVYF